MDRLQDIFEHKAKSSYEFRGVQQRHGLLLAPELMRADAATREGAIELHKGLHWINLELCEFIEAPPDEKPEEIADVLHFLVEFALLVGYTYEIIPEAASGESLDRLDVLLQASANDVFIFPDAITNARFAILSSLRVADIIKNKPWKQTLKPAPHPAELLERVRGLFYWYGATVRTAGISSEELYQNFLRKEEINHTRVTTGV